jgi:hypothetical protein
VIQRLRVQAAGKGIQFYVFVDDVLCVGNTEELTREGCRMLEAEFSARGVLWAPHKKRGPCVCIEFLGLLLSNVVGHRGVTITEKRLGKVMTEIETWLARRPRRGAPELEANPVELARLLGRLVFSSQVVKGGRTYMQGMLAAFKGLVVDWHRGKVSCPGGRWESLRLHDAFWRDLDWWHHHLKGRSLIPFESEKAMGEAVLAGTDASGWGTGQVWWKHGGREEAVLRFTQAEKRRPINWRELVGVLRAASLGGERNRGKVVMVETDNMAAKGAAGKLASKAADMQELVRRLLRASERYGFVLRVTHTPGEKLDRPDQTSRGDAVEEPRARWRAEAFEPVCQRWGPFDGFVGAEREHVVGASKAGDVGAHLWVHPNVQTVGTALRQVGQRLAADRGGQSLRAVVVVPDGEPMAWDNMLRHGLVVGRTDVGWGGLEMNELGQWRERPAIRPSRVVLFPRAAGHRAMRVQLTHREGIDMGAVGGEGGSQVAGAGYALSSDGTSLVLPLLPGSYAYARGENGWHGTLYRIAEPSQLEKGDDRLVVVAQEAEWNRSKAAKKISKLPVLDTKKGGERFRPDTRELFTVDHWVEELSGGPTFFRCAFNAEEAIKEIDLLYGPRGGEEHGGWEMLSPRPLNQTDIDGYDSNYSPFLDPALAQEQGGHQEGEAELADVVAGLEALRVKQSSLKTGPDGKVAKVEMKERGGETLGVVGGGAIQQCQYAELFCAGCRVNFDLGEDMQSHRGRLIHPKAACALAHDEEIAADVARKHQLALAAGDEEGYLAIYTTAVGFSGVYPKNGESLVLLDQVKEYAHQDGAYLSTAFVNTEAEGREFLKGEGASLAKVSVMDDEGRFKERVLFHYIPTLGIFKGQLVADSIKVVRDGVFKSCPELAGDDLSSRSLGMMLEKIRRHVLAVNMRGDAVTGGREWIFETVFNGPAGHPGLAEGKMVPSELIGPIGAPLRRGGEEELPKHACVLMIGYSQVYADPVVILGKLRGRSRGGKYVPFGGLKEAADVNGRHTALRELAEECFGLKEYEAAFAGAGWLEAAEKNGAMSGPFGRTQPHQSFLLDTTQMPSMEGMDKLIVKFKANSEISEARMVRVADLEGRAMSVVDVHGETLELRDYIGSDRVQAAKEWAEEAAKAAAVKTEGKEKTPTQAVGPASAREVDVDGTAEVEAGQMRMSREVKGSETRRAHIAEKLAPARVHKIVRCIAGECGLEKTAANATLCKGGCGRSLHVETCAEMGKGFAALGNFKCVHCRIHDPDDPIMRLVDGKEEENEKVKELTLRAMVLDLNQGAESTAAGYAEFVRLEEEYAKGMGMTLDGEGSALVMPRHSRAAFKNFLIWLTLDEDRARSLESVVRGAGSMFMKLQLTDHTKHGEVKALVKDLIKEVGIEHEPSDAATSLMLTNILKQGGVIDAKYAKNAEVAARTKVNVVTEGLAGLRIGEVAGGGDAHGLLANETAILIDPEKEASDPKSKVVEGHLEHSKTGFSRYFDVVGKSEKSGIEAARIYEEYWAMAGFKITETNQAGIKVRRPDFLVARVSLLGMNENDVERLIGWAKTSKYASVAKHADSTRTYARQRYAAHGVASQAKKYVNVAGGDSRDKDLAKIVKELTAMGFTAHVIAGPLLLATKGGKDSGFTLMPLAVSSVSGVIKELLDKAYELSVADPDKTDPDLDIRDGKTPKFSTHSLRRLANTIARRYRKETDSSEEEIDLFFGWNERVLLKAMQIHYMKLSIRERMDLAKITSKM